MKTETNIKPDFTKAKEYTNNKTGEKVRCIKVGELYQCENEPADWYLTEYGFNRLYKLNK